jgi:3-dehydroquinate synthase
MLDVVGLAVATFHRGLRLVRMPTTVLAQNDAGIGIKNGINAFGAKNLLGSFAAPFAVVADSSFLSTLEQRDRVAGMAEAVKVAAIRDAAFFGWLEEHAARLRAFEPAPVEEAIRRCAALHLAHIATAGDPFELGSARPLDFGHWAAHKLELLTRHGLRHGEAVAIGIALDTCCSTLAGLLDVVARDRVLALLRALGLPTWHDALRAPELLDGLAEFREHLGGELTITLLAGIGRGVDVHDLREPVVRDAIRELAS